MIADERPGIVVRVGGRAFELPIERLDAANVITQRHLLPGPAFRLPPADVPAFGAALFGPDWPVLVAAAGDGQRLGQVLASTYLELGAEAGLLPPGTED